MSVYDISEDFETDDLTGLVVSSEREIHDRKVLELAFPEVETVHEGMTGGVKEYVCTDENGYTDTFSYDEQGDLYRQKTFDHYF